MEPSGKASLLNRVVRGLNPLRLDHPHLPASLVLAARIMAAALVVRGDSPFRIHLPYLEVLDSVLSPATLNLTLRLTADVGYLAVIFTPLVRLGAGLTGSAYLVGLLACRPCHSVAHTYVACLLIVIALSSLKAGTRLVRAQLVILYAGAALNKTLDVDWWNGRYFETLLITHHANAPYIAAAALLPPGWLSTAMGAATIAMQWALACTFLSARTTAVAMALATVFHGTMVLLLNQTFGPFMLALFATYVALAWPPAARDRRPGYGDLAAGAAALWSRPAAVLGLTLLLSSGAWSGWLRNVTLVAAAVTLAPFLFARIGAPRAGASRADV